MKSNCHPGRPAAARCRRALGLPDGDGLFGEASVETSNEAELAGRPSCSRRGRRAHRDGAPPFRGGRRHCRRR